MCDVVKVRMTSRTSWGSTSSKFILLLLGGGSTLGCGCHLWHARSSLPSSVICSSPLFDSSQAITYEEHRRYPCQVLQGWDVVVRNYYVPAHAVGEDGAGLPLCGIWKRACFSFQYFFADHRERRLMKMRNASVPASSDVRKVDNEDEGLPSSATWPPDTQKFTTLVLEPSSEGNVTSSGGRSKGDIEPHSSSGGGSGAPSKASSSSVLQKWVDAVTDQTVIRCDPDARCRRGTTVGRQREGEGSGQTMSIPNCSNNGETLETPYLRTMLTSLAWLPPHPPPLHVGVLGVGGGAMAAFLLRYIGKAMNRMDLVDVEPMCLASALNDLGLSTVLAKEDVVVLEGDTKRVERGSLDRPLPGNTVHGVLPPSYRPSAVDCGVHLYTMDATSFLRRAAGNAANNVVALVSESGSPNPLPTRSLGQRQPAFPFRGAGTPTVSPNTAEEKRVDGRKSTRIFTPQEHPSHSAAIHGTTPTFSEDGKGTQKFVPSKVLKQKGDNPSTVSSPRSTPTMPSTPSFSSSLFDVLMVDLFVGSLFSEQQSHPTFLKLCRESLCSNGVVAFNVPYRLPEFESLCEVVFGKGQVHTIPVPSSSNYIVIASKGRGGAISHRLRCRRAREVTKWLELPYALDKELPFWWSYW